MVANASKKLMMVAMTRSLIQQPRLLGDVLVVSSVALALNTGSGAGLV